MPLFLSACPATPGPNGLVIAMLARPDVIPGQVKTPATLAEARALFDEFKKSASASGAPCYARAFWRAVTGNDGKTARAPAGLKAAIATGEFSAYLNLPDTPAAADSATPPAASDSRTPGQRAYEEDCARRPTYPDGGARRAWSALSDPVKQSWERNPTAREYPDLASGCG